MIFMSFAICAVRVSTVACSVPTLASRESVVWLCKPDVCVRPDTLDDPDTLEGLGLCEVLVVLPVLVVRVA